MTPAALIGYVLVPLFGVAMWVAPLTTRPTTQFGVRVPATHLAAPVLRRARRGYQWSTAVIVICATAVLFAVDGHSVWISRLILLVEIAADLVCFVWARQRIERVKSAENWFEGQPQTVVADTSWRSEPQRFPAVWLLPAVAVIAATVIVGVLRYPRLPPELDSAGGHLVATTPATAFAVLIGQLYVTGIGAGLLALVFRSRPDIDTADPAASLRDYRVALAAVGRAALVLLACIDLTLLLAALQRWQVIRLPGAGTVLVLTPVVLGLVAFLATAVRAGRARARTARAIGARDRDDDRFWKAGLVYVNRDDPALVVGARLAFGRTLNFGNPTAWLLVGGIAAVLGGLVIIRWTTGW